jgi:hypothetical protein
LEAPEPVAENRVVGDFGGPEEFTTRAGEPVSRDRPHGVTIVVASRAPQGWRYLLLHRAHHGLGWEGDWAWTPRTGSRKPGEDVTACAIRELRGWDTDKPRKWAHTVRVRMPESQTGKWTVRMLPGPPRRGLEGR